MGTYVGRATVSVGDDEHDVDASLRSHTQRMRVRSFGGTSTADGRTSWGGTLDPDDDDAAAAIMSADELPIRLWDAGQGKFVAVRRTVGGRIEIRGNGTPPF
ncbi:DUF4873 domain-containing protein [Streptomyces sp. NPDC050523]|uniref:DUF4873 domain-containing protein n=1 Tax=Streptomyces sp. NPDC050523 TaxID=3365622 RepID=UPI00379A9975